MIIVSSHITYHRTNVANTKKMFSKFFNRVERESEDNKELISFL